jgi:hypothetical protein
VELAALGSIALRNATMERMSKVRVGEVSVSGTYTPNEEPPAVLGYCTTAVRFVGAFGAEACVELN